MSDPASSIGCVFAFFAVIMGLFLYLLLAATAYIAVPFLGFIVALRIWTLDRVSAISVLVPSVIAFLFALYAADTGFGSNAAWNELGPKLAIIYAVIVVIELAIFLARNGSARTEHQKAGRFALKMALISSAAGLLLAYLTDFWPF